MNPSISRESPAAAGASRGANLGWVIGGVVIVAIFVVGGAFWFMFHP